MADHPRSPTTDNVTGHAQPVSTETLQPSTLWQVISMVRRARQQRQPLYPVSTGLNYGYGSAAPAMPGCTLMLLNKMTRIRNAGEISLANPVAVIEAGVTQQQLHDFLEQHCPELTFNVTGSAADTSILGNALDRGVGYFGPRREDVFALEVVCGSGKLLRTGFSRLGRRSPLAHSHPYGLGPMLDGLFFQGNFGVVTSACFRLVPKRPRQVALSLALRRADQLPGFIDLLAQLKREGLVESVSHVANQARTHATLQFGVTRYLEQQCGLAPEQAAAEAQAALKVVAPGEWTSLGAVTGTAAQVRANLAEVRRRAGKLASVRVLTHQLLDTGYAIMHALRFLPLARANAAAISAIRPLHVLALGKPTDAAIQNLLWKFGSPDALATQLDQSDCGLLFINPALPMNGAKVEQIINGMQAIAQQHMHAPLYITINIETPTSLVAVVNLLFRRSDPAAAQRAHDCADALLDYLHRQHLEVYRARADMMHPRPRPAPAPGQPPLDLAIMRERSSYWQSVYGLKQVLDPHDIIAPGRYNLPPRA